jgi:hypothetical protein
MAWSPNGEHLAVGNADIMQIWQASSLKRKNGVVHATEAAITWRPAVEANGVENGHADEDKELPQPSLSWSADGESLSFAADKKVCRHHLICCLISGMLMFCRLPSFVSSRDCKPPRSTAAILRERGIFTMTPDQPSANAFM